MASGVTFRRLGAAVVLSMLVAACGTSTKTAPTTSAATTTVEAATTPGSTSTTVMATTSTSTPSGATTTGAGPTFTGDTRGQAANPPIDLTEQTTNTTVAAVPGQEINVVLHSQSRNPAGAIVPWSDPQVSDPAVLPTRPGPACPTDAVCAWLRAANKGTATIEAVGPSGIVCSTPGRCVGITAARKVFTVTVG
jgi:hypothetical protein